VLAEVVVVDSRDAALAVIRTSVPDVLLLSTLLSPRDEDELIAHLRTLDAQHLQTHTIPQLASALTPGEKRGTRGLFSAFRRKKEPEAVVAGCDPDLFAEEIRTYLQRAEDKRRELQNAFRPGPDMRLGPHKPQAAPVAATAAAEETISPSSWESPFEWKPAAASHSAPVQESASPDRESPVAAPESSREPEPFVADRVDAIFTPEPLVAASEPETASEPDMPLADMPVVLEPEPIVLAETPTPVEEPVPIFVDGAPHVVVVGEPSVLMPQPYSVLKPASEVPAAPRQPEPVMAAPEPEPLFVTPPRRPAIIDTSDLEDLPEITLVEDPVEMPEPRAFARAAVQPDAAGETLINLDAESYDASSEEPGTDAGSEEASLEESGFEDAGFTIGESQFTIRTGRLGPLATWARMEPRRSDEPSTSDDLRMLLGGLAVPPAVAGVRYPRGCRIRRVRVPAAKGGDAGDSVGPVILSRRALADQREQTV
jgi:hypothetical protein